MSERATCEQIQRALTWWDFDSEALPLSEQRDHIVNLLERHYDGEQPYHVVDRIIEYLDDIRARIDETIMAVMDENHWGHVIPDGSGVTMRSFVFGEEAADE